ncbi:hypothetical protein C8R42DRAFT_692754 [Lentinula raphanica]|nr:hypothetical protein C8R42DRAFT_692754 [Lentinula raphanica]
MGNWLLRSLINMLAFIFSIFVLVAPTLASPRQPQPLHFSFSLHIWTLLKTRKMRKSKSRSRRERPTRQQRWK